MDSLFLSGHTYYNRIKNKHHENIKWYERLYIIYYENFKIILLLIMCIILYIILCNHVSTNIKICQIGGLSMSSKANKNMGKAKSLISSIGKKETYKNIGSKISSGYGRSKELASQGLHYGVDQVREKSEFIYKYIAMAFIGIGFTVYIFPVLAMFLIGALTFLIVRKSIAGVITM